MVFDRIDFGAAGGVGGGRPDDYTRARVYPQPNSSRWGREESDHPGYSNRKRQKYKPPKGPIAWRNPPPEHIPIDKSINLTFHNAGPQADRVIIPLPQRRQRDSSPSSHPAPLPTGPPPRLPSSPRPGRFSTPSSGDSLGDGRTAGRGPAMAIGIRDSLSSPAHQPNVDTWYRDVVGDTQRDGDVQMSSSSAPSGPLTFTMDAHSTQPTAKEPPRAPQSMQEQDDYDHSDCANELYSLRSELDKAKDTIKTLRKPIAPQHSLITDQNGWALDESHGVQALRDQCADLQRLLEQEREKSEAERVEHQRRLELKEGHITVLKGEMEIAQTDLRVEKERAQAALLKLQHQSPPPQGQLELAQSQLSKFIDKELKWNADKLLLQGALSRQKDQIETLQTDAASSATTIRNLKDKVSCQSRDVERLRRRHDDQARRHRENGEEARRVGEERRQDNEELSRAETEIRRLRGMLETAETKLQQETDQYTSKEREDLDQAARMNAQWRDEKEQLESALRVANAEKERLVSALGQARELGAKAEKERDEMKEAWEVEKSKALEEQMSNIKVTEHDLREALENAQTRHETAQRQVETVNADYEKAKREIERMKANEQTLREGLDRELAGKLEEIELGEKKRVDLQMAVQNIKAKLEKAHREKAMVRRNAEYVDRLNADLRSQLKHLEGSDKYLTRSGVYLRT